MASLNDFNDAADTSLSLDDFAVDKNQVAPVTNKASNLNAAAHTAIFSADPQSMLDTYSQVNAEMDASGQSDLSDRLLTDVKQKNFDKARQSLVSVLTDPNISDEQKQAAASNVYDVNNKMYSISNVLSSEALDAPVKNEPVEAERVRVNIANSIHEVNDVKAQQQQFLNSAVASQDPNLQDKIVDFATMLIPGSDQIMTSKIRAAATGEQLSSWAHSFLELGQSKQDIRDLVTNTKPEDRLAMTQKMIDIINDQSTINMKDNVDLARVQYLQNTLADGGYDDEKKWIDNMSAVLDMTVIGGALGKGVKALKGARAGVESADFAKTYWKGADEDFKAGSAGAKGGPSEGPTGPSGAFYDYDDKGRGWIMDSVKTRVQPATVSQNLKDVNPDRFKGGFEAAATDETGEVAQALYGTTREDALANDLLPEIGKPNESVTAKVATPDSINNSILTPNPEALDFEKYDGAIQYFRDEKVRLRSQVVNDFQQAFDTSERKEMFQVHDFGSEDAPDGVKISGVYGPQGSGYETPEDAREMVKWALRSYGVEDKDITVLKRNGGEYIPLTQDEHARIGNQSLAVNEAANTGNIPASGDYLARVDYKYKFNPADVTDWNRPQVKYNIFDRMDTFTGTSGQGSLQSHLLDPASMVDPVISRAAFVAADKFAGFEKTILDTDKPFADAFSALPKERKGLLNEIIKEQNIKSYKMNFNQMMAAGLTRDEIDTLNKWKVSWDTRYFYENIDAGRKLSRQGYMDYMHPTADTRIFAKPLGQQKLGGSAKVYDPLTDEIKHIHGKELDDLYLKGGTIAQMRQPMQVGDDAVELLLSKEAPGHGYLKKITDGSQVLNYRDGYYTVQYTDPYIIMKKVKNSAGKVLFEKAVATVGTSKDAERAVRRMSATDGAEYYSRPNRNQTIGQREDAQWDLYNSGGRSAQKVRGKRLEDANSNVVDPSMGSISNPVESLINSARSLSRRVAWRDTLETMKARAIAQYGEYLPNGNFGQKTFPNNMRDVRYQGSGQLDTKKLADARTTVHYINYLENGYINVIDDGIKSVINSIGQSLGERGLGKAEQAAHFMTAGRGPTALAKNIAFQFYLATNPLRQFVVQAHQAVQLVALNPQWVASAKAGVQTAAMIGFEMGLRPNASMLRALEMTADDAQLMYNQFKRSGLVASIDKQNLVRGSLSSLADSMATKAQGAVGRAKRILGGPSHVLRRIGFDAGEHVNILTSWLAHRDMAIRKGLDPANAEVADNITADARNFTYGMNAAGDLPYNQNFMSIVMQFLQVPHKALLSWSTNRAIDKWAKARLITFNALMYGLPPTLVYQYFDKLMPDSQEAKDLLASGLEGTILNKLLSLASGTNTRIDYSSFAPLNVYGLYDTITNLFVDSPGDIVAASPAGQFFFGNNPRLTNFAKTAARFTHLIDDYGSPVQFSQVALDFLKVSSGFSNAYKAAYALKYQQKINSSGTKVTDSNVTTPEAIAQAFGLSTLDEAQSRWVNNFNYEKSKEFEDDVNKWYKGAKEAYVKEGQSAQEFDYMQRVHSEAFRVFGENPRAKQLIEQNLIRDAADGDGRLYQSVLRASNYMSSDELKATINNIPDWDDAKRQQMLDAVDFINSTKDK